jgi:transposase
MKHVDMRKLSAAAQEERRRQVVGLRESGLTYEAIAAQVGLTRTGMFDICRRFAEQGRAGLASGLRGPTPGTGRLLAPLREAQIRALISQHTPDEPGLPFALWSRAAVRMLIEQHCGVRLAMRTVGTDLARWDFTAQNPLRRAYEQSPKAVRCWLRHDYPAIRAKLDLRTARSSGVTRPACGPTMGAAAASPHAAGRLWCAPVTSERAWA